MKQTLTKTLSAALCCAVMMSPLAATPAKASDAGKAIAAGTLGLVLLGTLAHAAQNSQTQLRFSATPPTPKPYVHHTPSKPTVYVPAHPSRGHHYGAPSKPTLPSACVLPVRHGAARGVYMTQGCLAIHGVNTFDLPKSCEVNIVTERGRPARSGYNGTCLQSAGYEIARQDRRAYR